MESSKLTVRFSANSHVVLDSAVNKARLHLISEGFKCSGIVFFPTREFCFAVRKDCFIYKESQEHYVYQENIRVLFVENLPNKNIIPILLRVNMAAGIKVRIIDPSLLKDNKLKLKKNSEKKTNNLVNK
jgi:ribosomal protein S10